MASAAIAPLSSSAVPADVDLVVLFGSRAKANSHTSSDWDLAIRFRNEPTDPMRLYGLDAELAQALRCSSDAVDVIDLDRSSYLLQRVVAEDGQLLFEREPGAFLNFRSRAIRQWADWVLRQDKLNRERTMTPA